MKRKIKRAANEVASVQIETVDSPLAEWFTGSPGKLARFKMRLKKKLAKKPKV